MMSAKRRFAIKAVAGLALYALGAFGAFASVAMAAQVAGTVVNLSGPLMVKKADGTVKVLALRSEVEQGDTLVSEKNTYAQIKFIDNSEMTLQPGTTFTIEAFAYDAAKPEGDSARFNLLKGGLRSVTGLLGKRNKEKFLLKSPTSTIGIRGTTFIAQYIGPGPSVSGGAASSASPTSPAGPTTPATPKAGLPPGLYVQVLDGMIVVANQGGALNLTPGQFGFTPSFTQPPVLLPVNPGIQFSLPPSFSNSLSSNLPGATGSAGGVNCIVQ